MALLRISAVGPEGLTVTVETEAEDLDLALTNIRKIEHQMIELGCKPFPERISSGGGYQKKIPRYIEDRLCPKCGDKLVYTESQNPKAPMIKCSTAKWDFMKKVSTGCDYIEWGATQPQRDLIKKLQSEGKIDFSVDPQSLTFDKAKELISAVK